MVELITVKSLRLCKSLERHPSKLFGNIKSLQLYVRYKRSKSCFNILYHHKLKIICHWYWKKIFCIWLIVKFFYLLWIVNQSLYVELFMHIYSQISSYLCIICKTITVKFLFTDSLKIFLWCLIFLLIIMAMTKYVRKASPTTHKHKCVYVETGLNCYFWKFLPGSFCLG